MCRYNSIETKYEMESKLLDEVNDERDLGVINQNDLKCNNQCIKAVKTANRVLGMIKTLLCYFTKEVVLQLYRSLVRPHPEYSIQAWRPFLKKISI